MRRRKSPERIATERRRRRTVVIACSTAGFAVAGFAGWLAYEGAQVNSNLEKAKNFATQSKDSLIDGDSEAAETSATDADRYAQDALDASTSLPWKLAASLPVLGSPFTTTQQLTSIVTGLTTNVLLPAVDAGAAIAPDQLIHDGGRLDLTALRDAEPVLSETATAAAELDARSRQVDSTYLGPVDDARVQLQAQTADLASLLRNTATAAKVAPAMLGADGPRSYFIGFQTNAEARGTGGLLGGFGVVRAENGAVRVDDLASNRELRTDDYQPIDLGPDFDGIYGQSRPTTDFRNSNVSSHFPYAAQIWRSLWLQESGEQVDGVVATDPVALSYVLDVVGPVTLPGGERITAENVVELTESTAYTRFADDNAARKNYLQSVASAVVEKMTGRIGRPQALLEALGRATSEGRLAVWSANPGEQAVLAHSPLGHTVPDDPAPYAGVVVNNLGGNKLDYHLRREIEYTAASCDGVTRESTVTVRLTNDLPEDRFTNYVAGMFDNPVGAPFGTNLADVSLVATQGAQLEKLTVNGKSTLHFTGRELGHPVFTVQVPIPRGETAEFVYSLTEPVAAGEARVPVQPLVDDPAVSVDVPTCG
ncbi:DUF4012 domain-containing protein [Rhodococcus gannanensis]|uniref:DUF4012 domain-containing protein n=1 Tax=Rhodococcus gannanensis TaxID=1960308 RepID=A0ABW4P1I1_9NOCA